MVNWGHLNVSDGTLALVNTFATVGCYTLTSIFLLFLKNFFFNTKVQHIAYKAKDIGTSQAIISQK